VLVFQAFCFRYAPTNYRRLDLLITGLNLGTIWYAVIGLICSFVTASSDARLAMTIALFVGWVVLAAILYLYMARRQKKYPSYLVSEKAVPIEQFI
jgi:hypothetical protein